MSASTYASFFGVDTHLKVDIFPSLVEAATKGTIKLDSCDANATRSRETALCTEGSSLVSLLNRTSSANVSVTVKDSVLPRPWAFSQCVLIVAMSSGVVVDDEKTLAMLIIPRFVREKGTPGTQSQTTMGYTMRTDTHRYTIWVHHNDTTGRSNFSDLVARELFVKFTLLCWSLFNYQCCQCYVCAAGICTPTSPSPSPGAWSTRMWWIIPNTPT